MSNRKWMLAIGLLVTALLIGCQTSGQTGNEESVPVLSTPEIVEVTSHPPIYKADVRTLDSSIMGRDYTIYVGLPRDYSAVTSYPVVYVLDGDYMTMLVWSLTDVLAFFDTIPPVIVVGIGYGGDNFDSIENLRAVDYSGSDFLQFLQVELIPEIEANYSTDPSDRTIFGHSLAGQACLHAMFHKPDLFQRYVVGSPSGPLQMDENEYAESHDDLPVSLYLFVGSLERQAGVTNLYDRLTTRQYPGLKLEMDILEGDTHFTVVPGATFKGLISVFGK
jgi:predicted alpha/beta superfamily hydrolase